MKSSNSTHQNDQAPIHNDQTNTNDRMSKTIPGTFRSLSHWAFGHSLVIGAWELVILTGGHP
jgi:hypothetical protein